MLLISRDSSNSEDQKEGSISKLNPAILAFTNDKQLHISALLST